jgi:hypothetical protein
LFDVAFAIWSHWVAFWSCFKLFSHILLKEKMSLLWFIFFIFQALIIMPIRNVGKYIIL